MCRFRLNVCTKSVAEMTVRLAFYVLSVAFVALYYINEIGRRASDVISYRRLCSLVEKKSIRHGSLCYERTRITPISVTTEGSRNREGFVRGVWPCQYVRFSQRRYKGRMIYVERKMLLGIAVKNEECLGC